MKRLFFYPLKSPDTLFITLLLLFIISKQTLWSLAVPLFQSPDEAQHVLMVALIDNYGLSFYQEHPPEIWQSFRDSFNFFQDYYHQRGIFREPTLQPPYTSHSRWADQEQATLHVTQFDYQPLLDARTHAVYTYPPLYYYTVAKCLTILRLFNPTLITYQFATRLFGMIFYLGFIVISLLLAQELLPSSQARHVFVGLLLFHPMFTFMGAMTNNDNALLPFSLLLFYLVAKFFKQEVNYSWYILLILTVIALILSKNQGFLLGIIVLALLLLVSAWQRNYKMTLYLAAELLISGFIFAILPRFIGAFYLNGKPQQMNIWEYLTILQGDAGWGLIHGTLGMFGWYEIQFDKSTYEYFFYSCLLVIGATLLMGLRAIFYGFRDWQEKTILFLMIVYLSYLLGGLTYQFVKLYTGELTFILQGRYFLSAFPIVCLAGVYLVTRTCATPNGQFNKMGWLIISLSLGSLIYLNSLAFYKVIKRFYIVPDLDMFEIVYRIMQYKPGWFKLDFVFYSLIAMFIISQIGIILFIFKDSFSLKINLTSKFSLRPGYIFISGLIFLMMNNFLQQPLTSIYWTVEPLPDEAITEYIADFSKSPPFIRNYYMELLKSTQANVQGEDKIALQLFLQTTMRRVVGKSKLDWLGITSPLTADVNANIAEDLATIFNKVTPYWQIETMRGFNADYQFFNNQLGSSVQLNYEQQSFSYLPIQVENNRWFVKMDDTLVEIGDGANKEQRFKALQQLGFVMPPAKVITEFETHGFIWGGYDNQYLAPTLFRKK